jgi:hypothetical protein
MRISFSAQVGLAVLVFVTLSIVNLFHTGSSITSEGEMHAGMRSFTNHVRNQLPSTILPTLFTELPAPLFDRKLFAWGARITFQQPDEAFFELFVQVSQIFLNCI